MTQSNAAPPLHPCVLCDQQLALLDKFVNVSGFIVHEDCAKREDAVIDLAERAYPTALAQIIAHYQPCVLCGEPVDQGQRTVDTDRGHHVHAECVNKLAFHAHIWMGYDEPAAASSGGPDNLLPIVAMRSGRVFQHYDSAVFANPVDDVAARWNELPPLPGTIAEKRAEWAQARAGAPESGASGDIAPEQPK